MSTLTKRLVQAIVLSAVVNTIIYVVGDAVFNVPFEVDMGGEVDRVDLVWVIVTSIVMSVAAYGVFVLLKRVAGP